MGPLLPIIDLGNLQVTVVKLDSMKFNYFVAGGAPHETLGEPIHYKIINQIKTKLLTVLCEFDLDCR